MTRDELKKKHLEEELEKINSLKNKNITQEEKGWFRTTKTWKNFRDSFEIAGIKQFKNGKAKPVKATDPLTGNPLKKGWQLHHLDLNSANYTELIRENFEALNPQSHDVLHWCYTQMCKDPKFIERLTDLLNRMYEINSGKDVKDFN